MTNSVNRAIDPTDRPDPTQGRRRECARRLRQMERARQKAIIKGLLALPSDVVDRMNGLDDAQIGFIEDAVERRLLQDGDASPEAYARAILDAATTLSRDPS